MTTQDKELRLKIRIRINNPKCLQLIVCSDFSVVPLCFLTENAWTLTTLIMRQHTYEVEGCVVALREDIEDKLRYNS